MEAAQSEHIKRVLEQLKREAMAGPHGYHECPDYERCSRHVPPPDNMIGPWNDWGHR